MLIKGSAWGKGIQDGDKARFAALVTTGEQKMVDGVMVLQYLASTSDLSVPDLTELRAIIGRGRAPWVEDVALKEMDVVLRQRNDPHWIAEQQAKAEQRAAEQAATEVELLRLGLSKLGGAGDTWAGRKREIDAWWSRLRDAEAAETWQTAFAQNRMSARQIGSTSVMGGTFTVQNKFDRRNAARSRTIELDRGAGGILARLVPANFFDPETGRGRKDELGLHDLSATLLDSTKDPLTVLGQLKPYKDSIVVFMPVPTEDDAQIFHAITTLRDPDGADLGVKRSSFTHIRFAQGSDMHTTLVDVSLRPEDPPKIRYGVTGRVQRARGEDEVMADDTDLAARRTNALRHSVILGAGAVQKVNEIVMAYRAHRSALFPLFAKWDGNTKRFNALARTTLRPTGAYVTESGEWHDR